MNGIKQYEDGPLGVSDARVQVSGTGRDLWKQWEDQADDARGVGAPMMAALVILSALLVFLLVSTMCAWTVLPYFLDRVY